MRCVIATTVRRVSSLVLGTCDLAVDHLWMLVAGGRLMEFHEGLEGYFAQQVVTLRLMQVERGSFKDEVCHA